MCSCVYFSGTTEQLCYLIKPRILTLIVSWSDSPPFHLQNVERACPLYQTYPENESLAAEGYRNPYSTESGTARGSPRHMTITERLRKVIQELVDTEKSYVKVHRLTQLLIEEDPVYVQLEISSSRKTGQLEMWFSLEDL